ncbi:MAG: AAA family ATPase [Desulfobacteria bacterium]
MTIASFYDERLFGDAVSPSSPGFDDVDEDLMQAVCDVAEHLPVVQPLRGNGKDTLAGITRIRPPLFQSLATLLSNPPRPQWLVRGLIETPATGLIFGASGAGKSFVAVDLAAAIATGRQWAGRDVGSGPVFYIAGEGRLGLLRRFSAWQLHHKVDIAPHPVFLSTSRIELDEAGAAAVEAEADRISTEIGASPALIIVDTLARALPSGGDENSAKDVGAFINLVDRIRDRFQCVILILHHVGHVEPNRARGSSALRAAMDVELRVSYQSGIRSIVWSKLKDSPEEPRPSPFVLEQVLLETSEEGEPVFSAVVNWKGTTKTTTRISRSAVEDLALATLREAIGSGVEASLESWRPLFYAGHWGDNEDAKRKAFKRVRDSLRTKDVLHVKDDLYSINSTAYGA